MAEAGTSTEIKRSLLYRAMRWLYRGGRSVTLVFPAGQRALLWTDWFTVLLSVIESAVRDQAHHIHGRILDIGSGAEPHKALFSRCGEYLTLDLPPAQAEQYVSNPSKPTVYGDGQSLPFRDAAFDTVLCLGVIRYVAKPVRMLSEIRRVLKPGGVLVLHCIGICLNVQTEDRFRYTPNGFRYLAEEGGLIVLEITPMTGLWTSLALRAADSLFCEYVRPRNRSWMQIPMGLVLFIAGRLDAVFGKRGDTIGHTLVARKPT